MGRQLDIGEKRAAEQNRIASVREKLLELKMKELQLQKAKFERKKKEQEEKEKATEDFIAMIDQQLEKMEANVDPVTGTIPKQLKMDLEAMGEKLLTNSSVKPVVEDKVTAVPPVLEEPRPAQTESIVAQTETDRQKETPVAAKNEAEGKDNSPEPLKPKNKKNKKKNKNKNRKARSQSRSEEVQSPKPEPQPEPEPKQEPEPEKVSPSVVDVCE